MGVKEGVLIDLSTRFSMDTFLCVCAVMCVVFRGGEGENGERPGASLDIVSHVFLDSNQWITGTHA